MKVTEEDDLHGPALSRIDYVEGAPKWWTRGAKIRNKSNGQEARAAFSFDAKPVACLERGIAGTFKVAARYEDWEPNDQPVQLTDMDLARITYAADRALLTSIGYSGVPEWTGMLEAKRIAWMGSCKVGSPLGGEFAAQRNALRDSILEALVVGHG